MGIRGFFRQVRGYGSDPQTKTRIPFLKLWGEYLLSSQNSHRSDSFKKLRKTQYTDGSYLYSDTMYVTSFYTIDEYPRELIKDFKETIRNRTMAFPKVRISFIDCYESDNINFDSYQVKAKMKNWELIAEEEAGQTTAYNIQDKVVGNQTRGHREDSLVYLSYALRDRGQHLYKVRTLMVVTGERGDMFDKANATIVEHCAQLGLVVTKIEENLEDFMRTYSPFSLAYQNKVYKEVGNPSMTNELLAQTYTYTQGKVGDTGKYWGLDVESGFPVFKEIKQDPKDAENILITGQTGSGKSFYAKAMILQMLCDNRFFGTIMDYEGTEYKPLIDFVRAGEQDKRKIVQINMGAGTGSYFDPVPICQINVQGRNSGSFTEENNPFEMSKSYTTSLLSVICCREREANPYEAGIMQMAIDQMYRNAGVTANPNTWQRSQNLSIHNVYRQIQSQYAEYQQIMQKKQRGLPLTLSENAKVSEGYIKAIEGIYFNASQYLGDTDSTLFTNPIRLEDISTAKLVVCSFGMLGRSPDSVSPMQLALMSNSAALISHIRSLYSKAQGKLNFKVWEEFQRWSVLPGSVQTIKVALTGGRKLGDVNIIITNDIKSILLEDKFALIDNLTTMAIGLIGDASTRDLIMNKWPELEIMRGSLDKISDTAEVQTTKKKNQEQTRSKYDKAFLVYLDRRVSTVTKMHLPAGLARSDIFKTAVEVDEKNKKGRRS